MKEEIKSVQSDIKRYALLEAVERSEGGQMLLLALKKDASNAIDKLISFYKTAPDVELRTWCAILSERMSLVRSFERAPINRKFASKELDKLLKAEVADEEE